MKSMLSVRGKKLLVVEEYTFRKDKETGYGVSYRCTKKSCSATICVDKSEQVLLQTNSCHNHPCLKNLPVKELQNAVKKKAIEDVSQRPSKIINLGLKQGPADLNLTTKDIENIRKSMYRSRRRVLPPLTRSADDVHDDDALDCCECKTNKDEVFLLDNHEEDEAQNTSDIFQDFEDESWTCPQEVNPIDSDDDNLPLVCKTEESEPNETAIQQITDNPIPDFQCNLCLKEITGFRYRCLVCPDYEMCGECERCGGHHDDHYVLRVPMQRPTAEVEQVESAMRHALSSLPAWKQPSQRAGKRKKTPPKAATKKNLNSTNHEEPENSKSETENETDEFVDQPTETMENRQQTFTETATVKEEVIEFEETAVKLELEPGKADLVEEAAQDSSSDDSDDVPLSQYPRYVPPSQYPRYVPPTKKRRDDDLHSSTDSPTMQSNGQTKKISSRLRTS